MNFIMLQQVYLRKKYDWQGETEMSYWKLGCNWGRGMPDFYSLLKEKWIVICGDHSMAKDDWVLICQGHDAVLRH